MLTPAELKAQLTTEKFIAWLDAHDPAAIVGLPKQSSGCPLANYLEDTICEAGIHETVAVSGYGVWYKGTQLDATQMPQWTIAFIKQIDYKRKGVTAKAARGIVNSIVKSQRTTQ